MMQTTVLRRGSVTVSDHRCSSGPGDAPFAEQHGGWALAYVRSGAFSYSHCGRRFEMAPGAILAGHPGDDFVCSHDHVHGDHCLSFHFAPELAEAAASGLEAYRVGAIGPHPELMVLGERAAAAADADEPMALEEAGLTLAARFAEIAAGRAAAPLELTARDRRRAALAALWLDANSEEEVDLKAAADFVCLSPFHFLRIFKAAMGATPHQYLVACRLRHAARRLAAEDTSVSAIAFEVGFGDLSNFVRSFRRAAGVSPGRWRAMTRR